MNANAPVVPASLRNLVFCSKRGSSRLRLGVTNVEAAAVRTVAWLSSPDTTIAVPVYQRQYRWDTDGCRRLLDDIRTVADGGEQQTHFIGSILSTATKCSDVTEWTLIDGQQRVSTLTLLVAALYHTVQPSDPLLARRLERMLVHPSRAGWRTKVHTDLRPDPLPQ